MAPRPRRLRLAVLSLGGIRVFSDWKNVSVGFTGVRGDSKRLYKGREKRTGLWCRFGIYVLTVYKGCRRLLSTTYADLHSIVAVVVVQGL